MNKTKIIKSLILLSLFSLVFINPNNVQAVPDPEGNPTLEWSNKLENCEIWGNTIHIHGDYLYIACFDTATQNGEYQIRVEKRNKTTGSPEQAFGVNGAITIDPSSNGEWVYAFDVSDIGIFIGIIDFSLGGTNSRWRIEKRDIITGESVAGFGNNGVVIENISNFGDGIESIVIHDQSIFLAGYDSSNGSTNTQWRIEKRDANSGNLLSEFDEDGIILENPSIYNEWPQEILIEGTNIYIGGYDRVLNESRYRIEKRDLTTGVLIAGFGDQGIIYPNPSSDHDFLESLVLFGDSIFLGGTDGTLGINTQWRVEKRNKITGELITNFGNNGVVLENPSNYYDGIKNMVAINDALYIGGYDYYPGEYNGEARIAKRDVTTGNLITSFGNQGILLLDNSVETEELYALTNDATGLYIAEMHYDYNWTYHYAVIKKYSFPEDSTPPTFTNLPGGDSPINLTEGQNIATNPYIISVKPADNIEVDRVEFFVDNTKICTDTEGDIDGIYSCSWDTSLYHSDIRVVAYDTTGNQSVALTRSVNVDPALYVTELPRTGLPLWLYSLLLLPISFVTIRKLKTR